MIYKSLELTSGILVILLIIHIVATNIEDNEVNDTPEYHMIQGVKIYNGDRQCVLVGGLCVHTDDCNEPTTTKGLCPSNTHHGVECCYELPVRPAPCSQHLGECMDRCHKTLVRPGTDCSDGQTCCLLI